MLKMIRKEFLINKSYLWFMFVFFMIFYAFKFSSQMALMFIAMGVIINSFYYDEKSKAEIYYASLPMKRNNMVLAKYLFIILFFISTALLIFLVDFSLYELLSDYLGRNRLNVVYLAATLFIILLLTAMLLPFLYQFGLMKGIVYFGLFFTIVFSLLMLKKGTFETASDLVMKLFSYNPIAIPFAFIIVLMTVSYFISIMIYRKKDLD